MVKLGLKAEQQFMTSGIAWSRMKQVYDMSSIASACQTAGATLLGGRLRRGRPAGPGVPVLRAWHGTIRQAATPENSGQHHGTSAMCDRQLIDSRLNGLLSPWPLSGFRLQKLRQGPDGFATIQNLRKNIKHWKSACMP